ncbi:hypothetical protein QJQ45_022898 [Haematococcus lacustris]|nr:hypothetical protein QJQ45_022898 [Haematococcus lacustris]
MASPSTSPSAHHHGRHYVSQGGSPSTVKTPLAVRVGSALAAASGPPQTPPLHSSPLSPQHPSSPFAQTSSSSGVRSGLSCSTGGHSGVARKPLSGLRSGALSGPRLEVAAAPATPDAGAEPGLQQLPDLSRSCSVLDEEVLLRMVQAAEEQPGPSQLVSGGGAGTAHCMVVLPHAASQGGHGAVLWLLRLAVAAVAQVAHGMLSLDRTVLGSVLSSSDGGDEGTWIADVAAYMTQPNRPGRDIVTSPLSPSVASLVIACMNMNPTALATSSGSSSSSNRQCQHTNKVSSAGEVKGQGQHALAVYLTSGTPLTPLQLQALGSLDGREESGYVSFSQLGLTELEFTELELTELGLTELELTELGLTELELTELELTELELTELEFTELELTELGLTELELTELEFTELELTELELTELELTELGLTELELTELGLTELELTELELTELGLTELELTELELTELELTELGLTELEFTELELTELGLTELELTELGLTELELTELELTELGLTELELTELEFTELELTELGLTELELTELEFTELELTELELTELELTELGLTELELTELGLTELELTELELTELGLTELELTELELTELELTELELTELAREACPPAFLPPLIPAHTPCSHSLQAVLKEVQSVLRLLQRPVTHRLCHGLREEWSTILSTVLGQALSPPPSLTHSFTTGWAGAAAAEAVAAAAQATPVMGAAQTAEKRRQQLQQSHSGSGSGSGQGLLSMLLLRSARQRARVSLDFDDCAPDCLSAKGEGVSSRAGRVNSCSNSGGPVVYSRGPLAPQVAPLVTGLQDRLLRLMASNITGVFNRHEDLPCLKVEALVAHGGFGSVFKGLWQGLEVAIKVIPQRMDQTDSVREAVELAVMSTVSHPNILGVQNYWTDVLVSSASSACRSLNGLLSLESGLHPAAEEVVEVVGCAGAVAGSAAPGAAAAGAKSSHIQRMSVSAPDVKRSLVIVMELCDQGSLDEAIHSGAFRLTLPGKAPRINMLAVLTTLLEVAMALRHMHAMQLVHCDLKPGNVLLKSSLSDVRHFTTKLCDFGLVKLRQEALDLTEQIRRATFTGTVTHSPPEMLRGDPNPQFAYDTYAFGILMWCVVPKGGEDGMREMVSWTPVYAGLSDRQVAQQVVYNNLRPEFPRGMDPQYRDLAQRCWAPDPGQRPTMAEVVLSLSHMLMGLRARAAAAANSAVLHGLTTASSTQRGAAGQLHAGGQPQRPSHYASHPR